MKIVIAQLNPIIGAIQSNLAAMLKAIRSAPEAQLIVFPELAVSGYPPKDLLDSPAFVDACLAVNTALAACSNPQQVIIWGNIHKHTGAGKPLCNAAYMAYNGNIIGTVFKNHLPTYDVFNEARYFQPGLQDSAVGYFDVLNQRIALTVCEDLWCHPAIQAMPSKDRIAGANYATDLFTGLAGKPVDYLVNISASPFEVGKPALRRELIQAIAKAQNTTVIYANQVGANDDVVFDGNSLVSTADGQTWALGGFVENAPILDLSACPTQEYTHSHNQDAFELIEALTLGIRDYVTKTGFSRIFIGLSGGIDSAVTAALACRALGPECVTGIAMPGPYSSGHSLEDAKRLAHTLNLSDFRIHAIHSGFEAILETLTQGQRRMDLAEQNLQARLRGVILMTLANRENALLLATGNKSELAMGYSTLYGDSCGALAPLGDVFKTQVYALAQELNRQAGSKIIPQSILDKPPSAELAPDQKDSDTLPPYDLLDAILLQVLVNRLGVGELTGLGYDSSTVLAVLNRVMTNEFKRQQMPPCLKVSPKAFGSGRLMPIVQHMQLLQPDPH